jgi:ribosomal protein L21
MTKTFSLLFVFLFLVSCGKSGGGNNTQSSNNVGDAVDLEEVSVNSVVPSAALNFEVNLNLNKFNSTQEDKVLEAADLIKKVVASEEFKKKVLSYKYRGKKAFNDNAGLSNAQIYKKIIEGSEKLRPGKDNEMDLDLEVYKENNNTVGYTYPSVIRVWMNSKYLNKNSPAKVTTNMMHEWLHKLGFKHDVKATPDRKHSVPYAIGYIVAKLAARIN